MNSKPINPLKDRFLEIDHLLSRRRAVSVLGIPGMGISIFLKQMAAAHKDKVLIVDIFSMPELNERNFLLELLLQLGGKQDADSEIATQCIDSLREARGIGKKIIIFIPGFDQLRNEFTPRFFQVLRALGSHGALFVFGVCRPLSVVIGDVDQDVELSLFSTTYFLQPFTNIELEYLCDKYGPKVEVPKDTLETMIIQSGGHFQLLQLLLGSEHRNNPVSDPFVRLACKNIYDHFSSPERALIRRLVLKPPIVALPEKFGNLEKLELVKKHEDYRLFSPIFAEYVATYTTLKLPTKERMLLKLLKQADGDLVNKRVLLDTLWEEGIGSEWALNALIYRLRRHPVFVQKGYSIENQKKEGYRLTKN